MYEKIQGALAYPLPLIFQNPQSSLMPLLQITNHFAERMDISSSKKFESLNLDIEECIIIANNHLNNDIAFQNDLAANFTDDKIELIRDSLAERLDESEKTKLKNLVEAHLLKYMSIINEQFCKRLGFSNFMYPQGLTKLNQHFVAQNNNNNLMVRDHAVSSLSGKIINDDGSVNETYVERLRKFSGLMTLMFYDHKYLDFKSKPTNNKINFWIALNSLVDDENKKNYISQIYNAEDAELTDEQKALKAKLHDTNFRQAIIDTVKNKCKEYTKPKLSISKYTLDTIIPKYYFEYIMHTPWNSLTPDEQEYKKNFYALIKGKTDIKIAMPTGNEQTLIESNLDIKNFFNALRQNVTPIPSQLKIYSKSENQNIVTTDFNQLPDHEAISQKIEDISHSDAREILFALEEKSPVETWSIEHIEQQVNTMTQDLNLSEPCQNFIQNPHTLIKNIANGSLNSLLNNQENLNLICQAADYAIKQNPKTEKNYISNIAVSILIEPSIKSHLIFNLSRHKGIGFLKDFAEGKFNDSSIFDHDKIITKTAEKLKNQYPASKRQKIYQKIVENPNLSPALKTKFVTKMSDLTMINGNKFIENFARGIIPFNKDTASLFLQKLVKLYTINNQLNTDKLKKLLVTIADDRKTSSHVKSFIKTKIYNHDALMPFNLDDLPQENKQQNILNEQFSPKIKIIPKILAQQLNSQSR